MSCLAIGWTWRRRCGALSPPLFLEVVEFLGKAMPIVEGASTSSAGPESTKIGEGDGGQVVGRDGHRE